MYPTPSSTSCEAVKGKAGWFIGICSLVFPACLTSAAIRSTSKRNFGSDLYNDFVHNLALTLCNATNHHENH